MYLDFYLMVREGHPQKDEDYSMTWMTLTKLILYTVYDKLGDGCRIDFPVRLESRIKWSIVVYYSDGSAKPRVFTEMISVTLVNYDVKVCCIYVTFFLNINLLMMMLYNMKLCI